MFNYSYLDGDTATSFLIGDKKVTCSPSQMRMSPKTVQLTCRDLR